MDWQDIKTTTQMLEWFDILSEIGIGYAVIVLDAPYPIENLHAREIGESFGIVVDIIKNYKIKWN